MPLPPLHLCKHLPLFLVQWPVWHVSVYSRMFSCQFWISSSSSLLFLTCLWNSWCPFSVFTIFRGSDTVVFCHIIFLLERRHISFLQQAVLLISQHNTTFMNANNLFKMCYYSLRWTVKYLHCPFNVISLIYGDSGLNFCMIHKTFAISFKRQPALSTEIGQWP